MEGRGGALGAVDSWAQLAGGDGGVTLGAGADFGEGGA